MGWNPQFKFSLRDDQVTFGNLIIDKNCALLLSETLMNIKKGVNVNPEALRTLVQQGCYTDEEFDFIHEDFDNVKEDIKVFKQLLKGYHMSSVSNWTRRMDSKTNYIVGSVTWIQHYKETKLCAAELYNKLLEAGFNFSAAEKSEYSKRYAEILSTTTREDRIASSIRDQYFDDLRDGKEDAMENYIQAMVASGVWTESQAKAQSKLLNAGQAAVAKKVVAESVNDGVKVVNQNSTIVKETKVSITTDVINEKYSKIVEIGDALKKAVELIKLNKVIVESLKKHEIMFPTKCMDAIEAFERGDANAGAVIEAVRRMVDIVNIQSNSTLIDLEPVEVNDSIGWWK